MSDYYDQSELRMGKYIIVGVVFVILIIAASDFLEKRQKNEIEKFRLEHGVTTVQQDR